MHTYLPGGRLHFYGPVSSEYKVQQLETQLYDLQRDNDYLRRQIEELKILIKASKS